MPSPTHQLRLLTDRALLATDDRLHRDPCAHLLRLAPGSDPYPLYEAIRSRGDLTPSRRGLLFAASHRTVSHILRTSTFGVAPTTRRPDHPPAANTPVHPLDDAFLSLNPPRHTQLRALITPHFHRTRIDLLTAHIEQTTADRLHNLHRHGPVDLISALATPIPTSTICHLMGLPPTDIPRFTAWGKILAPLIDGPRTPRETRRTQTVIAEMTTYLRHRLAHPGPAAGDGLLGDLSRHCPADLTAREAIATAGMLLLGGHATTVNLIANAIAALLHHPTVRIHHRDDADAVIEETLRWDPPVQYTVRTALQDTTIGTRALPAGTPIVTLLAAAGRDPDVFNRPQVFDPGRAAGHLGFGTGIHFCLGAALARLEARIVLTQLYARYDVRLAGPAERSPSRCLRGLDHLPVHLTPRRQTGRRDPPGSTRHSAREQGEPR